MTHWWTREQVALVDDRGHAAVPVDALHSRQSATDPVGWVEVPGTRWGVRHRELTARANFGHLERTYPVVQRVLAIEQRWRCLIVRDGEAGRLERVWPTLEAGGAASQASYAALLRRMLRARVEHVEGPEVVEGLPELLRESGSPAVERVEGRLDGEAVVRAYLVLAADTAPLPEVDAMEARFPAHDVVVQRLVQAVTKRPELVTVGAPLGGAPSWQTYERWVLG